MRNIECIVTCIVLVLLAETAKCDFSDIVRTDDEPTIGPVASPRNRFHFISTGMSHIFWSHVASTHFKQDCAPSEQCKQALAAVSTGLSTGDILPFHFVDASSKTPSGFIRSSLTSFGDYDQCLTIDGTIEGVAMKGKYCAVDLFPLRVNLSNDRQSTDTMTTGELTFDRLTMMRRVPFIHSVCVPSQCSTDDLRLTLSAGESPEQPLSLTCLQRLVRLGAFSPRHMTQLSLSLPPLESN